MGGDILTDYYIQSDKKETQKYSHFLMLGLDKKDLNYLCEKKEHEYMKKYMKNVEELNEDSEFVSIISPDKDNEMVINTLKNEAIKEGRLEGKLEGMKEGIKEGIKEGRLEGKRENTLETAKALLKENVSIDIISRTTGLTKEEINSLK